MTLKNILYAGLLALSAGCNDEERFERWKQYCEEEHSDAVKEAQETGSEELNEALNSKQWCAVKDDFSSDWVELCVGVVRKGAMDYCDKKNSEASQLVASNENRLTQLVFQKNFRCDGKRRRDLMIQANYFQMIIIKK